MWESVGGYLRKTISPVLSKAQTCVLCGKSLAKNSASHQWECTKCGSSSRSWSCFVPASTCQAPNNPTRLPCKALGTKTCTSCNGTGKSKVRCSTCSGTGLITSTTPCEHNKTEAHYSCRHGNDYTEAYHECND